MAFWTYIMRNYKGDFYVGHTSNLDVRVSSHNRNDKISGKFTRKNGPWKLAWSEEHPDRASAMRRERQIKSWKSAKLIRQHLLHAPDEQISGRVPT
jgi:predicted GIY-YIG superfamily endonuclease